MTSEQYLESLVQEIVQNELDAGHDFGSFDEFVNHWRQKVREVVAAEREACAQIAEKEGCSDSQSDGNYIAHLIRARGKE